MSEFSVNLEDQNKKLKCIFVTVVCVIAQGVRVKQEHSQINTVGILLKCLQLASSVNIGRLPES